MFCLERTPPDRVTEYREMGAARVVLRPPVGSAESLEEFLAVYAPLLGEPLAAPAST